MKTLIHPLKRFAAAFSVLVLVASFVNVPSVFANLITTPLRGTLSNYFTSQVSTLTVDFKAPSLLAAGRDLRLDFSLSGFTNIAAGNATVDDAGTCANFNDGADSFAGNVLTVPVIGAGVGAGTTCALTITNVTNPATSGNKPFTLKTTNAGAMLDIGWFAISIASAATNNVNVGATVVGADPLVLNVSSANANAWYKTGDTLTLAVTFSEAVVVTGTPHLTLDTGAGTYSAPYFDGSGSATLNFIYLVQSGDATSDLDYSATNSLALTGGTILADDNGAVASLTLANPGFPGSLGANKNLQIDGVVPAGGALTYANVYQNGSTTVALTVDDGTDSDSGIDAASRQISERHCAMTSGAACVPAGVYVVGATGGIYPNLTFAGTNGNCYQFRSTISDTAANSTTYTSSNVICLDTTAPSVSSLSPADNATLLATNTNLTLTFSEQVSAAAGKNLTLRKTADDSLVETIAANDGAKVSGSGSATITINPAATLANLTEYYVLIDAGAFRDNSLNSYAGIASTTAWSFTTIGVCDPSSVSNGSVGAYPACTITCNSGYSLSGSSCVSSGGGGGGGGGGGAITLTTAYVLPTSESNTPLELSRSLDLSQTEGSFPRPVTLHDASVDTLELSFSKNTRLTSLTDDSAYRGTIAAPKTTQFAPTLEGLTPLAGVRINSPAVRASQFVQITLPLPALSADTLRAAKVFVFNPQTKNWEVVPTSALNVDSKSISITTSELRENYAVFATKLTTLRAQLSAGASESGFSDTASHWADSFIARLVRAGKINGKNPNEFAPDDSITRAELTKIALNVFDIPLVTPTNPPFRDIALTDWFATFVATAKARAVIGGYSDGTFAPDQAINRAEALKIFFIASGLEIPASTKSNFADVPSDAWFASFVAFAENEKVVGGFTEVLPPLVWSGNKLQLGSSSSEVTKFQKLLTELGYYDGPITGYFGPLTQQAVLFFHLRYPSALAVDGAGVIGSATAVKLIELVGRDQISTRTVFRPEQPITRAEAVKIALLIAELAGKKY